MARSKNRGRTRPNNTKASATPLTVARAIALPRLDRLPRGTLIEYEDRRTHHPNPYTRPAFSLPRSAARLVVPPAQRNVNVRSDHKQLRLATVPNGVAFEVPSRVAICVRRKERREVLFAIGKRKAGSGAKRRRRSAYSQVSC